MIPDPRHILRRETLHAWGAIPLYVAALAGLWLIRRFLPSIARHRALAACIVLAGVVIHEIRDLLLGGWWGKSLIDLAVWAAALALLVWFVRRFKR